MKKYYKIILGKKNYYADKARKENFVGIGFIENVPLSNNLADYTEFSAKYLPMYLELNPERAKLAASHACTMLWKFIHVLQIGDTVLCPDGKNNFHVGEISSNYEYQKELSLPHIRKVTWHSKTISKTEMSDALSKTLGARLTLINITKHADEIESLLSDSRPNMIEESDGMIENASDFALEKQLEEFLVENWHSTELGEKYDIYEADGDTVGQQYYTGVGEIDILAISKDKKSLLVIELKKGRASDRVVGQCLRYMGFIKNQLAEPTQSVHGRIIAHGDDDKIRYALSVTQNIEFYTYKINFQLEKKQLDEKS